MKLIILCFATLLTVAHNFPRSPRYSDESSEVEYVPYGGPRIRAVDIPSSDIFPRDMMTPTFSLGDLLFNQYNNYMKHIEESINRLKAQLASAVNRLPPKGIDWSKFPNATSTTKIIDGHVVTVNETTYTKKGDNEGAVFHIRVVDVKPTEGSEDSATEGTNRESAEEESKETNEVPTGKVGSKIETLE